MSDSSMTLKRASATAAEQADQIREAPNRRVYAHIGAKRVGFMGEAVLFDSRTTHDD
jgi:hypothetical protein